MHKEDFLRMWSSVWYSNHTAERQKAFDLIYKGVDRLIADATPSDAAELERDEKVTWEQTHALIERTFDIADKLNEVGFRYMARSENTNWEVEVGWRPGRYPGFAVNERTRPYQWLRREATSNMGIMQAVGRPRMIRRVLTPFQGEEPESSTGSDASSGSDTEAPSPM